jgi:sugar phosphate permease
MSLTQAGFYGSSLVPISATLSQLIAGPLSDIAARSGLHKRMLMQAVLILCAAPALLTFLFTHNQTAVMVALILYSIFRSCGDLNMIPLLCDVVGKEKRSTALGITNMVNTLAGGLGIFVAGFLKADFGLAGVFAGVAGILALDAAILFTGYALFLKKDLESAGAESC